MDNVIDLSSPLCPEVLRFHDMVLKKSTTGLTFYSWNGLRLYWITGKTNPNYLNGTGLDIIGSLADRGTKDGKYEYISDLYERLENELRVNMARYPLLKLKMNSKTSIIWNEMGITPAEENWVKVVQRVAATM